MKSDGFLKKFRPRLIYELHCYIALISLDSEFTVQDVFKVV